ncbi:caspase family protein [Streptomyces sp. NPDC052101]|uniref:caspase family protein n=1 Tax=Streptomyces sp. NPDC052101 TaxID=3155763 RepID=UPI00342DA5F0
MGRWAAIAIGVGRAPGLRPLKAACQGARDFAKWAREQGFDPVIEFLDEVAPVTFHAVDKEVNKIVEEAEKSRNIDRLFIYFAGHGKDNGTGEDCWLLSGVMRDGREAINLTETAQRAWDSAIPHVAFFGDACRVLTSKVRGKGLSLFPDRVFHEKVEVDQFHACAPGAPAHELPPDLDAPESSGYGLYTKYLVAALSGEAPAAIAPTPGAAASHAVLSRKLRDHLADEVPWRAGLSRLVQEPRAQANSHWPDNVMAWIDKPTSGSARPQEGKSEEGGDSSGLPSGQPEFRDEVAENLASIEASRSLGLDTGISVHGAQITKFRLISNQQSSHELRERNAIRGRPKKAAPILLQLDRAWQGQRMWSASTILPDYATQLRVGRNGVAHIACFRKGNGFDRDVMAWVTARSRWGWTIHEHPKVLTATEESLNPVLVVLMAHSLHRSGQTSEVSRLLEILRERNVPVPFDVALMAEKMRPSEPDIAPGYPWTMRGWYLLGQSKYGKGFARMVEPYLAPAFWTTLLDPPEKVQRALLHGDC